MNNTILKITCLGISVLMLASCAKMADNIALVDKTRIGEDNKIVFAECKTSVQFSDAPRKAYLEEMAHLNEGMGDIDRQWEVEGFVYEKNRLAEMAVCLCSDAEIFDHDVDAGKNVNSNGLKLLTSRETESARAIYEFDMLGINSSEFKDLLRITFPKNAQNCLFVHVAIYPKTTTSASSKFIDSYQPVTE